MNRLKIVSGETSIEVPNLEPEDKELLKKLNLEVYELPDTEDTVPKEG